MKTGAHSLRQFITGPWIGANGKDTFRGKVAQLKIYGGISTIPTFLQYLLQLINGWTIQKYSHCHLGPNLQERETNRRRFNNNTEEHDTRGPNRVVTYCSIQV